MIFVPRAQVQSVIQRNPETVNLARGVFGADGMGSSMGQPVVLLGREQLTVGAGDQTSTGRASGGCD